MSRIVALISSTLTVVLLAASQFEALESAVLNFLGTTDYGFIFVQFRQPILIFLLFVVAFLAVPQDATSHVRTYLRSGWRTVPVRVGRRYWLHPEEILLVLFVVLLGIGFLGLAYERIRQGYLDYGLGYLASNTCSGEHEKVASRATDLLESDLWSKYHREIKVAELRAAQMSKWQASFERQFFVDVQSMKLGELEARVIEHGALFGLNERERDLLIARSGGSATSTINSFAPEAKCRP